MKGTLGLKKGSVPFENDLETTPCGAYKTPVVHTWQQWYTHAYIVLESPHSYLTRVVFHGTERPGWC